MKEQQRFLLENFLNSVQNISSLDSYIDNFKLDFEKFGSKTLEKYQKIAIKSALKALSVYYKKSLKYDFNDIYGNKVNDEYINRASVWMATGSGKTLVIIKLISLLHELIKNKEFPKKPILLLVPNEQILEQFKAQIAEFNQQSNIEILLKDIKEYESSYGLFDNSICELYFYRSDLLDTGDNVAKDKNAKRIEYKNFFSNEGWYIFLDEAHKGETGDSLRKEYIKELSKAKNTKYENGFIFNFSATFSDNIDLSTCCYNYNLEKFNQNGYGKNIFVFDENINLEQERDDKRAILESFILFWAIKSSKDELINAKEELLYHNPLIIAVSDKVNTEDAGIKLYFECINDILENNISNISQIAKNLAKKLENKNTIFSQKDISTEFIDIVKNVNMNELRKVLFYANGTSKIEALKIQNNQKEIAFKSKNANKPFMLLNIGDIKEWSKNFLAKLGVIESEEIATTSYFANINDEKSSINIMIGSKVFSEGWDSNRVNIAMFLNIGSRSAKKYITQTIGRGVRIEPFKNERKRLEFLNTEYSFKLQSGIETLFVLATDPKAIEVVLKELESYKQSSGKINVIKNKTNLKLLVPKYEDEQNLKRDYIISRSDYKALSEYINSFDEDVLLLSCKLKGDDFGLKSIKNIKNKKNIKISGDKNNIKEPQQAIKTIHSFFNLKTQKLKEYKILKDEITHFNNFSSSILDDGQIQKLNESIKELVKNAKNTKNEDELLDDLISGKITKEEYKKHNIKKELEKHEYIFDANLSKHYYLPIIIDKENKGHIKYAINNESEITFLDDLKNNLKILDGYKWCFSKLVENVDDIYIPYFDEMAQSKRKFYPDFIFWLEKNNKYFIVFIDPKGLSHQTNPKNKIQGFKDIFSKKLSFEDYKIKIKLCYYNKDYQSDKELAKYTFSNIEDIFKDLK